MHEIHIKVNQLQTMTFYNNQAFSQHEKIAESLKVHAYFTRPNIS